MEIVEQAVMCAGYAFGKPFFVFSATRFADFVCHDFLLRKMYFYSRVFICGDEIYR